MQAKLAPALPAQMVSQLIPALALCGAASMSEDDRDEWLTSAMATLIDMPLDLLMEGCAQARRKATHPSQIVPAIFAAVGTEFDVRKRKLAGVKARIQRSDLYDRYNKPEPDIERCTPEQAAETLAAFGMKSKYSAAAPRMPTADELAAMAREGNQP